MCGIGREIKKSTNRTVSSGCVVSCEKSRFQEGDIALNFKKGDGGPMANVYCIIKLVLPHLLVFGRF